MLKLLLVFIGGGLGSVSRYSIAKFLYKYHLDFPLGTFIANVISCIILGALLAYFLKVGTNVHQQLLLITGFCGGFSTFSSFSSETFQLFQNGQSLLAITYVAVSLIVCLFCIWLGFQLSTYFKLFV